MICNKSPAKRQFMVLPESISIERYMPKRIER